MKGLFCFDGPMYRDVNGIYCNTTLTNNVFNRYLEVVDELVIAIRTFHLDKEFHKANLHEVHLNRIRMVELPNLNSVKGLIIDKKSVYKQLYKIVQESDLVFARMPSVISNIVIKIAIKLQKPYLVEVGGCVWDAYWNHSIKGKIIAPFLYYETKKMIRKAPFAVYVTNQFLQKRYPNRFRTESCSNVSLSSFNDSTLEARIVRISAMKKSDQVIIGTTAAIDVTYKGQELIIEAISKLNKQGYNFVYELVGAGSRDYLESIARKWGVLENVKFLGIMLNKDVIKWLDKIDIYAQPSKQEGLPRALIEAMSRGCPSIGSITAGIPELLPRKVLFQKGNVNQICNILKDFTKDQMKELAAENFVKSQNFDSKTIEERRQKVFSEFLSLVRNKEVHYEK